MANPSLMWYYDTEAEPQHAELGSAGWLRGRTLGGSSSLNGMIYVRGQKEDYDHWATHGAPGWDSQTMQRAYGELEKLMRTTIQVNETELLRAILQSAAAVGIPERHDPAKVDLEGLGFTPCNIWNGRRMSASHVFLRPAERRSNLTVVTDTMVDRLILDGQRAIGVVADSQSWLASKEVIVSAGTIESPALLQRSGIGSPDSLASAGVKLTRALPGVGKNLREHKVLSLQYRLRRRVDENHEYSGWRLAWNAVRYFATRRGPLARTYDLNGFWRSRPDLTRPDFQIVINAHSIDRGAVKPTMEPFPGMTILAYPLRPTSTGTVDICSPLKTVKPRIRPNYLATEYDQQVTVDMTRLMRKMARTAPLADLIEEETFPGPVMTDTNESILQAARRDISCAHAVGTCRIGDDPMAVVDSRLRVHGMRGLRVMDCSVFPTQVSGNTNAPVMAMAWHAADLIIQDAEVRP